MQPLMAGIISLFLLQSPQVTPSPVVLGNTTYSLTDRYGNTFVNDVFSDNILLTLAYMSGVAKEGSPVPWDQVRGDFTYRLSLNPGEIFAFHDRVLPQYVGKIEKTTNAHFNSQEGFRSDHYLVGDGVCHLASFMNVVAREAGLTVVAPTNHNFAKINDVARADGVAIYYDPQAVGSSALQNLYITNNQNVPIVFVFRHVGSNLDISVEKVPLLSALTPLI